MLRTALVQMKVEGGAPASNLRRAEDRIAEAAAGGAQVIVLPEAIDAGWTDPSAATVADRVPGGAAFSRLSVAAARHRVYLCAGLTEIEGGDVFNTAVLVGPGGDLLGRHRKLNELEIAHGTYAQGASLGVVHTPVASFGLAICADAFACGLVLTRALGYMGADVILSPCAWAVPRDHDNLADPYGSLWEESYRPVAREFALWIVAASSVGEIPAGPWAGRRCIGNSMVVAPSGEVAARGPYGPEAEAIVQVELDPVRPRPARGCGWERRASSIATT